jgi:hypothetical protein
VSPYVKFLFAVAVAYSNLREHVARLEVPDDIFTMGHQGSALRRLLAVIAELVLLKTYKLAYMDH